MENKNFVNINSQDLKFVKKSQGTHKFREEEEISRKSESGQETINTNKGKKFRDFSVRGNDEQKNQENEQKAKSFSILVDGSAIISGMYNSVRSQMQVDMLKTYHNQNEENDIESKERGLAEEQKISQYRSLSIHQSYVSRRVRKSVSAKEKQIIQPVRSRRCGCELM